MYVNQSNYHRFLPSFKHTSTTLKEFVIFWRDPIIHPFIGMRGNFLYNLVIRILLFIFTRAFILLYSLLHNKDSVNVDYSVKWKLHKTCDQYSGPCMSTYAEHCRLKFRELNLKKSCDSSRGSFWINSSQPEKRHGCRRSSNMAVQLADKFPKALWVDRSPFWGQLRACSRSTRLNSRRGADSFANWSWTITAVAGDDKAQMSQRVSFVPEKEHGMTSRRRRQLESIKARHSRSRRT